MIRASQDSLMVGSKALIHATVNEITEPELNWAARGHLPKA
jgi:hypothetical protein